LVDKAVIAQLILVSNLRIAAQNAILTLEQIEEVHNNIELGSLPKYPEFQDVHIAVEIIRSKVSLLDKKLGDIIQQLKEELDNEITRDSG